MLLTAFRTAATRTLRQQPLRVHTIFRCSSSHTAPAASSAYTENITTLHNAHMMNGTTVPDWDNMKEVPTKAWIKEDVDPPKTSILMELTDRVGILHDVLKYFWKFDVNICRIESRPKYKGQEKTTFDFCIDLEGSSSQPNVQQLIRVLRGMSNQFLLLDPQHVHWFPRHISELDTIADRTLDAGIDLQSDHPGFADPVYRQRRAQLAAAAQAYRWDDDTIPIVDYSPEDVSVWTAVWDRMEPLLERYACREYRSALAHLQTQCPGYTRTSIPQAQHVSDYLWHQTQFRMRPVAGLLSSRDFLNGLAFRVFFSTQYIRHHSQPLYTPEPDVVHELLGHAPMFADRDFADFSQEIGLASLGASDDDIDKLAHCYWHSVEFGLCREGEDTKAYGAGLLSSFGELEYACGDGDSDENKPRPTILPWDPEVAARQAFPITTYQPTYFLADSLPAAKQHMREYCERRLSRPFFALHNTQTQSVSIDRPVQRTKGVPEADGIPAVEQQNE